VGIASAGRSKRISAPVLSGHRRELTHERRGVGGAHEGLTHEHGVVPRAGHPARVVDRSDRALGDGDHPGRDALRQPFAHREVLAEVAEVAGVDPDDARVERERAVELGFVVRLDEDGQAESGGRFVVLRKRSVV
jgi:hypothetical protein